MMVAAHQPTFLPWLGWWDKFVRADTLILLDVVQFPRTGAGTWLNRVRMLVHGSPAWVTLPIDRSYRGVREVRDICIADQVAWRAKTLRTISTSYARGPHFDDVYPAVEEVLGLEIEGLADYNEAGIRRIAEGLGLDTTKLVRQSDLHAAGASTDLLIELCERVGGTSYLNGDGSAEYLEPEKFSAADLQLIQQNFVSPRYPQLSDGFVEGLSIVDALMNCGWEGTAALLAARQQL